MVTIRIFVASSKELEPERDKFASLVNQLNRIFKPRGLELDLVLWEYLDNSMSKRRKQDEYNEELRKSEICLVILWNKLGKYTVEEFKIAYGELCAGHNPQRLYVFFKEPAVMTEEMANFKNSFEEEFGHFYSIFENSDTLKLNFLLQLELYKNAILDIQKLISMENSFVTVDGVSFVDFRNVAFASKNADYVNLQQQIDKQRNRVVKYPDDIDEQKELHILLEKRQEMEDNMINLARKISEQTLHDMSPRMIEARRLFELGELRAVVKILDTYEILSDIKSFKTNIQLYDALREKELLNIEKAANEIQLRIKAEKILLDAGWTNKIIGEYEILIDEIRNYASPYRFAKILFEAARFIEVYAPNGTAINYYKECIDTMKSIKTVPTSVLSDYGNMLFYAGRFFTDLVYEIDCDPTMGEWMDDSKRRIHDKVMKRWKKYKIMAKEYLEESVEIFKKINNRNEFSEDIYHSLKILTHCRINDDKKSELYAHNRLIKWAKKEKLSAELLLSALCDYAITLCINEDKDKFKKIVEECECVIRTLNINSLTPYFLLDISTIYEMKMDYNSAESFCRKALLKYRELSEDDPYIYSENIADCLRRIATYIHWQSTDYRTNKETKTMLDKAGEIYENLYKATKSYVYLNKAEHIRNFKFELRVRERMDYGEYIFNLELDSLKKYLSSHISSGEHIYNIDTLNSPIKNIGTIIKKKRNKDEYHLSYTWEIDDCKVRDASIGSFIYGTKKEVYEYLSGSECYNRLKDCIIREIYKSWHMD